MSNDYVLNIQIEYQGVMYEVVDSLEHDLFLAVKKEDLDNGKFPLQTYIIPQKDYIEKLKTK